ncbi:MAG: UbiX family flavin prenyltransferase [Desulfosarcina sp.]|nr:UbiX family flavin prenyltransferase [Desulfosarcina sp.]MBC2743052.1 UbiX family flavin prenyltransferase [Desulfosarcina sp.]MBC2765962.1 UbiX family flavin prenyltransferase [Desulfosarcina sp.]
MAKAETTHLILGITGASGIHGARLLVEKSPWPVDLVASRWGRDVAGTECGGIESIEARAARVFTPDDLYAPLSSGSVPAVGMVVLPCSAHTLAQIAAGLGDSLITRAAHCQLKERRPLILCLRESPLTLIDLENARRVAAAGAVIMPMSPPFFMFAGTDPKAVSMDDLLDTFVDRVLALLGRNPARTWEDIR